MAMVMAGEVMRRRKVSRLPLQLRVRARAYTPTFYAQRRYALRVSSEKQLDLEQKGYLPFRTRGRAQSKRQTTLHRRLLRSVPSLRGCR